MPARLRLHLLTFVTVVYLLGLWVYQIPHSSLERTLAPVLGPIQKITFTNRQYRMHAPDPTSSRNIPILLLKTTLTPVRFLKNPPGLEKLNFLSREKWGNFIQNLVLAQTDERAIFSPVEGWEFFGRLAARICRDESGLGDRALLVSLQARPVRFGVFQSDIVWESPEPLEDFECP